MNNLARKCGLAADEEGPEPAEWIWLTWSLACPIPHIGFMMDHDCVVEHYGRVFGKPMGFYVQAFGSDSMISFLINAQDAQSGSKLLTCVSSCIAAMLVLMTL